MSGYMQSVRADVLGWLEEIHDKAEGIDRWMHDHNDLLFQGLIPDKLRDWPASHNHPLPR